MLKNVKSFLLGIIAASLALFLEVFLSFLFPEKIIFEDYFKTFTYFLLGTVIIEEGIKALSIFKISKNSIQKSKFLINSLFLGAGFGATEIFLKNFHQEKTILLGFMLAFFVHLITCFVSGIFFSKNKTKHQKGLLFWAILTNSLIHLSYNLIVIYFFN